MLAVLLMAEGRPVSVEALIDRVWGEDPPAEVRRSLHVDVSRLRRRLKEADESARTELRAVAHTYVLDVDQETVDLYRCRRLRAQATSILDSGDREEAAALLREAERSWLGEPLAGLSGRWVERSRVGLDSEYRTTALELIDIELDLGRHADMIGFLVGLIERYPLDETFAERLMVAYYRCGRQADAVSLYMAIGRTLRAETGMDPGPQLRELHQRILHHDPSIGYLPQRLPGRVSQTRTLPDPVPQFTGRAEEITSLTEGSASASNVIVIEGMPGVGKTALAVGIAHRLTDRYSDGTLYLHLHAHDPHRPPADPAHALAELLRMLGHSPRRIPRAMGERARLWRDELAGRRMLIVLDDTADSDQVRPLLPGNAGSKVVITSRRSLHGLPGADSFVLGVLSHDDAAALFDRVAASGASHHAELVAEAVRLCGYLPLAIRIAATSMREGRVSSVEALVEHMRDIREDIGDAPDPEVAAAFELSYRDLSPAQQQAFRRLGLSPVPELTAPAVAALTGVPRAAAGRTLAGLSEHSLLEAGSPGRFRFHDLIRQYSRSLAAQEDSTAAGRRAVGRMLDHYRYTADRADRMLYPYRCRREIEPAHDGAEPLQFAGERQAQEWMAAEWRNLFLVIRYAADHEWSTHTIDLAHTVAQFFDDAGHWEEAEEVHHRALRAGQELEIPQAVALAHLNLAVILWRTGRTKDSFTNAGEARRLCRNILEPAGEAAALDHIGLISWFMSEYRSALAYFAEAYEIYVRIGDTHGQAGCLGHSGMALWHTGRYTEALDSLHAALALYRSLEDRHGQANTLNNIADVQLHMGYHRDAARLYVESQEIYHVVEGRRNNAILLANLGNVDQYKGRLRSALHLYRGALKEFKVTGDRMNESGVLNDLGSALCRAERYDESLIHHRKALSVADAIGHVHEQARAHLGIGEANAGTRRYVAALDSYRASERLARTMGDPYLEARSLSGIADATLYTEGRDAARIYWRQAHDLFGRLGLRSELETIRIRLQDVYSVGS